MTKQSIQPPGEGNQIGSNEQVATPPESLTPEVVQQMIDAAVLKAKEEAAEEGFRRAQSFIDKKNKRINEEIGKLGKILEAQRAAGIQITPEQERALQQQVADQVRSEEEGTPPGTQPPTNSNQAPVIPPTPGQGQESNDEHPAIIAARQLMQEEGVTIEDDDPEKTMIDMSTPVKLMLTLPKAIEAKRQRLTVPPVSKLPGITGGGPQGLPDNIRPIDRLNAHFQKKPIT